MKKIFRNRILFIVIFLIFGSNLKAQYVSVEQQKADLIYKFPQFLIWEDDEYIDEITIGIYKGSYKMVEELKKATRKKYLNGTKATLVEFTDINEIAENPTYLLYIENNYNDLIPKILEKIKGSSIILITDSWSQGENIMFNLLTLSSTVTFEFNREVIKNAGVAIVEDISTLGGTDIDAQSLLDKAKVELKKTETSLKEKQKEIETQQKEIVLQKEKITDQKTEITKQQESIKDQKLELTALITQNEDKVKELAEKSLIVDNQNNQIKIQQENLIKKQEEYETQLKLITEKEALLASQKAEVEKYEDEINAKQNELVKLNITIQIQRYALLILGLLVTVIVILIFFVLRGYRIKKKQNQMLEEQKEEIQAQAEELSAFNIELEKLSIVASQTSSAVAILEKNGDFEWVNAGFTRLYGYTIQLLSNELDENIVKVSTHPKINEILERCISNKKTEIFETYIITRDGQKLWAQTTMTPILNSNQEIAKIVLIDSDITMIKEAEQEIKRQTDMIMKQASELEIKNKELAKLSLVAEKTTNSVIITYPNGEIEWVNAGFERLMDISFEDFKIQTGGNILNTISEQDDLENIDRKIKEKSSATYTTYTKKDKDIELWKQTTLTPIFNDDESIYRLVAVETDITKIKLAEQEIARQNTKITESIHYAKRIQNAVIPTTAFVQKILPQSFILFLPKDIVSGDFYWVNKINQKIIFTAADCTGHGVPGAFMSMLGISFLNEIINKIKYDEIRPDIILNQLRENIKKHLRQTGKEGESKDGMDIAFCMLDEETNLLHYAGAHNPLLLLRNNEMTIYNADEMPIGIYYGEKEFFTNNIIKIQNDDVIYLFSDGYPDQFGGKSKRKYMIKRFRDYLFSIHKYELPVQGKMLHDELDNWRGSYKQLDDILVMGVKF